MVDVSGKWQVLRGKRWVVSGKCELKVASVSSKCKFKMSEVRGK